MSGGEVHLECTAGEQGGADTRVFVSFDLEHDEQLYEQLLGQSGTAASGFEVVGSSDRLTDAGQERHRLRQRIREADQVIVICGEHTVDSLGVCAELRIAGEERTPHILLWGHRETMCTKPIGAEPAEGMYSWTPEILKERLTYIRRAGSPTEASATLVTNAE